MRNFFNIFERFSRYYVFLFCAFIARFVNKKKRKEYNQTLLYTLFQGLTRNLSISKTWLPSGPIELIPMQPQKIREAEPRMSL